MNLVLDASASLAWILKRADPDEHEEARSWLRDLGANTVRVPTHFVLEVVNGLAVAERRGVIEAAPAQAFLTRLAGLEIILDPPPSLIDAGRILQLARHNQLTAYDAIYLDLAMRTDSALATFDKRLATARDLAGVPSP